MILDMLSDWLGLGDFLVSYPAFTPLIYCIVGVFAVFMCNVFWTVLCSIFSIFDSRR